MPHGADAGAAAPSPSARDGHGPEAGLARTFGELRACTVCAASLPLGARPVARGRASARLLIISQAPGTRAHEAGLSFDDRSGDRLRLWLGLDRATFYDETRIALLPMGFCYPGRDAAGGDLPPRAECAPLWHAKVLGQLRQVELSLLVGSYAIDHYLADARPTMTETVAAWRDYLPARLPLPHPSWRTTGWERRNPWFAQELLPELRCRLRALLDR